MVEAEVRTREMGRWRMGPGAKQCGVLEELDEAGNKFLLEPPEGPALLTLVYFAPWDLSQTSALQNWKMIHWYCSEPPSLWPFVTAARGSEFAFSSSGGLRTDAGRSEPGSSSGQCLRDP